MEGHDYQSWETLFFFFFQNGVLKGPGGGVYSSLGWGLAACLCVCGGGQQVLNLR